MANKDDVIELEGTVVESLPNTMFKVDIGGGHIILAHLKPPPTSLPILSLWVIPVHQPQASAILH